jgi:CHAT domain-containing protein/Flp pilus assembly protein TadD
MKIPQLLLICLLSLSFLLFHSNTALAQGGLLDKLKNKVKDKTKQKTKEVKNDARKSAQDIVSDQFEEMRNGYDSTNFSFAIALSDNSGLYEYEERAEKYKKNLVMVTDLTGVTEDQSQDPLKPAKDFNDLGQFSYANNRFKRAEYFFKLSKTKFEESNAQNTIYYPKVVGNMGLLYLTMGRYDEALTANQSALKIRKDNQGTQTSAYATSLNNLAMTYKSMGKYNEAEQHFNEALELISQLEGKQSVSYAIVLNNKGMLFQMIGRYEQAEKLIKEALEVAKITMREKSNNYQRMLVNLALLYQDQKRYEDADKIFQNAIKLKENRLGNRNHPDLAHMLNLQAALYVEMGKDDQVEALLQEALRIYEKKFGTSHPAYASTASNLGNFYRVKDKLSEAEPLLKQAFEVRLATLGEKHPDFNKSQEDLALVYWQMGKIAEATQYYRKVIAGNQEFIRTYFPPMSELEKERYWNKLRPTFLRFYSFATDFGEKDPSLLQDAYQAHLSTKAILLSTTNKIKNNILKSNDANLIRDYQTWIAQKEQLVKYYAYSKEDLRNDNINIDSLESATNTLEKSISNRVPELFEPVRKYADIINKLQANEATIDILSFQHFDKKFTDETHYAFFIGDKAHPQTPQLVLLKNGSDLDQKYYKYYRNSIQGKKEDKYSYENFWAPVDAKLTGKSKVFISLDGVYNQISLNTLRKPDGKYLVEGKTFVFLTNSKDLLAPPSKTSTSIKEVLLVGFPDYGNTGKVTPLPGTKVEVQNIDRILKQSGYKPTALLAQYATETAIKAVKNPGILHVATHGYFLSDPINTGNNKVFGIEIEKARENSLLRSGIFLANAESAMAGQDSRQVKNEDNGILTAFEVSNLALQNTTVVMSACDTGLGDVKAGEGVYGLQRALQIAGSDIIIMSLWQVSDQATQELMTLFYKNYTATQDKAKAFRDAQIQLKAKFADPYYWGAFVMIGR